MSKMEAEKNLENAGFQSGGTHLGAPTTANKPTLFARLKDGVIQVKRGVENAFRAPLKIKDVSEKTKLRVKIVNEEEPTDQDQKPRAGKKRATKYFVAKEEVGAPRSDYGTFSFFMPEKENTEKQAEACQVESKYSAGNV